MSAVTIIYDLICIEYTEYENSQNVIDYIVEL